MTSGLSVAGSKSTCIQVDNLTVRYRVRARVEQPGARKRWRRVEVNAVSGVDFGIDRGEIIGFLGPNGAGKTSVLKCLSGLLRPTSGTVRVLGHTPHRRHPEFLSDITLIMGQRNQLLWDLPVVDTFLANKAIYRIGNTSYRRAVDDLVDVLTLGPLLDRPVRQLSLGERTRCELAAALLHEPQVLFLDEPTLGLDVEGQQVVRDFITRYRARRVATILLTSHDMADIVGTVDRVLLIDRGRLRYSGDLASLVERAAPDRIIRCRTPNRLVSAVPGASAVWWEDELLCVRTDRDSVPTVVATLLRELEVSDIAITGPSVEDMLRRLIVGSQADDVAPA